VRLVWSEAARRHLQEVREFIAQDNPDAADRLIALIATRAETLEHFPLAGRLLGAERRALALPPSPYSLVYRVTPDRVLILGVRHGARAWR
jgi:plasmid stabilization system protein ParE